MAQNTALKEEDDILNLPDDQIPDYPPTENTLTDEGENDDTDTQQDLETEDDDGDSESEEASLSDDSSEEEEDRGEDEEDAGEDGSSDSDTEGDIAGTAEKEDESNSEEESLEEDNQEGQELASKDAQAPLKASKGKTKAKAKGTDNKATDATATAATADEQLQNLFAPFKANGRDMQVASIDDARILMQMGANYNKKMAGLKPNMKLIKMLDNNKLLDEEKLSYLIDLSNKNPEAIAKLIQESGIDPHELDEDKQTNYKPNTYTVDETEIDLDMALDDIKDTSTFNETIDVISNKWDADSKKAALKDPTIIKTINAHIGSGMYKQVMDIVQNEKAMNRLTSMSDLQAYKHVGDTLQAQGAFNTPPQTAKEALTGQKPKAQQDPELKNRKKAAATTRSKPAKKKDVIDPLSMTDDEFEKMAATMQF